MRHGDQNSLATFFQRRLPSRWRRAARGPVPSVASRSAADSSNGTRGCLNYGARGSVRSSLASGAWLAVAVSTPSLTSFTSAVSSNARARRAVAASGRRFATCVLRCLSYATRASVFSSVRSSLASGAWLAVAASTRSLTRRRDSCRCVFAPNSIAGARVARATNTHRQDPDDALGIHASRA